VGDLALFSMYSSASPAGVIRVWLRIMSVTERPRDSGSASVTARGCSRSSA
jgi:hypothetical protein